MAERMWAHHVKISVFCKPEDDYEALKATLKGLVPFDLEKEKIKVEESRAEGFGDRKIRILEIFLKKESHTQAFLKRLMSRISPDQKAFLQKNMRVDEDLNCMIDLDKNRLQNDQYWLVTSGPCFHIRIRAAAFPRNIDAALERILDMLSYQEKTKPG